VIETLSLLTPSRQYFDVAVTGLGVALEDRGCGIIV